MVYTHINHVLLDSPAGEGPFAVGRPSRVGPDVGRGARPARPPGPTFGCRTPRARGGPPRTSAPTTHPAPTRSGAWRPNGPGARSTRAALDAGRPNGPGARRNRAALGAGLSEGGGGTARRDRFVVDEKAAFARRGGNGAGGDAEGGRVL